MVNIFKTPGKTILNGAAFEETIQVLMNATKDNLLQTIGQKLGEKF